MASRLGARRPSASATPRARSSPGRWAKATTSTSPMPIPAKPRQNLMAWSGKRLVWRSRLNRSSSAKATSRPSSSRQAAVSWLKQLIPRTRTRPLPPLDAPRFDPTAIDDPRHRPRTKEPVAQARLSVIAVIAGQPAAKALQVRSVLLGLRVVSGPVGLGNRARRAFLPWLSLALDDLLGVLTLGHRRVTTAAELRLLWLPHRPTLRADRLDRLRFCGRRCSPGRSGRPARGRWPPRRPR